MTSRDRVLAAGRSETVDRIPVTPYMGNYGASLVGVPVDEYGADASTMADAQIAAQRCVGHDMLVAQSDGYYMAEALGMRTTRRPGTTPAPAGRPLANLAGVDTLAVADPWRDGRMPVYLEALRTMRAVVGDRLAVRACGTGPFSLAGHLMGPDLLVTTIATLSIEPDARVDRRLRLLMDVCTETAIAFAVAALESGADVVMSGDSLASLDMISPPIYEHWVWPYERHFFDCVRPHAEQRGALTLLHICGNTVPILRSMASTGAHVLEIDWKVPITTARDETCCKPLMGNLDPTSVLLQGSPDEVLTASRRAIADGLLETDSGEPAAFLLGSGCEVAPATPVENVRAMVSAAHEPTAGPSAMDQRP